MSVRRFLAVFRRELAHHLRRPLTWFLVVILALMSWGLTTGEVGISSGDSSVGGRKAFITSQYAIGFIVPILVLIVYSFFLSVASGMCIIQDDEWRTGEILHTTGLTAGEYVWAKFLAVVAAFVAVLLAHLAFMAVFFHVLPYEASDKIRGPFAFPNYLVPGLVFGLPTIVFLAGLTFLVGERTRKPILVYFFPIAILLVSIFFLWNWSPGWLSTGANEALMLVEPSGFRWINEVHLKVDRGVDYYNSSAIEYDGVILANRVAFLVLGLLAAGAVQLLLPASIRGRRVKGRFARIAEAPAPAGRAEPGPVSALLMRVRPPSFLAGVLRVASFETRALSRQPGMYLFIPLILIEVIPNGWFATGAFDTPLLVTPGVYATSTFGILTVCLSLLLLFYTVEAIERDKATGVAGITWSSPVRTASLLLGKSLSNGVVAVLVLVVTILSGIVIQLIQGKVPIDLVPYGIVWGLLLVPTVLLWSTFVMALRAVTGNRYATYALGLGALILTGYKLETDEISWAGNWAMFGALRWTDMGPFELDRTAIVLNRLLALALSAFFLAIAVKAFNRREWDAAAIVSRLRPGSIFRAALRMTPVILPPLVLFGALSFAVAGGRGGKTFENRLEDYWKKNNATWRDAPAPDVTHVELDVTLEPEKSAFETEGTFDLVNPHAAPLGRFSMTGGAHWTSVEWTFDGAEHHPEERSLLYVFEPAHPIEPGGTCRVGFRLKGTWPFGVSKTGGAIQEFILPAGVVLTSAGPSFVPIPGYVEEIGVDDDNRAEPRDYPDDFYVGETPPFFGLSAPFSTRISITAPEAYTLNSIGTLSSETVSQDGKRTAVWESDYPVTFFNIVAGKWAVRRGTDTVIHYHPEHVYNVEEMSEALDAARKHYARWFHEYPWRELKLSEFPALADYAQGFATDITFSESIGFLTQSRTEANAAFLVTAHEAAHQWWGNLLTPGKGPGGNILSEGMSHFSALLLTEEVLGLDSRIETAKRLEESYAKSRQIDSERPLVKIDGSRAGDQTVTYDKGGWVFFMLHRLMGEEASFRALRAFMAKYAKNRDHPVLQDFVETVRPFAPDAEAFDAFAREWFFDVVVPEYRLSEAKKAARAGGGFEVTVMVENAGSGRMPLEIAAVKGSERFEKRTGSGPARVSPDYRDARATVTLGAGERATVTIPCDFEPEKVIVDPDAVVLQLRRNKAEAEL